MKILGAIFIAMTDGKIVSPLTVGFVIGSYKKNGQTLLEMQLESSRYDWSEKDCEIISLEVAKKRFGDYFDPEYFETNKPCYQLLLKPVSPMN